MASPPPAAGARLPWTRLPSHVLAALENWLGEPVVRATSQPGGFSPGIAARAVTAGGRRLFVKAIGPEPNPDSPGMHRRESQIVAALPLHTPVPRLLWQFDDGGWVVLAFEDVEGRQPRMPWQHNELDRVIGALHDLWSALTPSPITTRMAGEVLAGWAGWSSLASERVAGLDAWSARHLDALAGLEQGAPAASAGEALIHLDLRADNLLLTADRVLVVDWPAASMGAAWVDVVGMAPSVTMQGGPAPEEFAMRFAPFRRAEPEAVNAVLAAVAGYLTHRALLPPPPGLPTLRPFQAAQGEVARQWLAQRTGWR